MDMLWLESVHAFLLLIIDNLWWFPSQMYFFSQPHTSCTMKTTNEVTPNWKVSIHSFCVQEFPLKELLCCEARDSPRCEEWLVESLVKPGDPFYDFQCFIDIYNIPSDQSEGSANRKQVTMFIGNINNNGGFESPEDVRMDLCWHCICQDLICRKKLELLAVGIFLVYTSHNKWRATWTLRWKIQTMKSVVV